MARSLKTLTYLFYLSTQRLHVLSYLAVEKVDRHLEVLRLRDSLALKDLDVLLQKHDIAVLVLQPSCDGLQLFSVRGGSRLLPTAIALSVHSSAQPSRFQRLRTPSKLRLLLSVLAKPSHNDRLVGIVYYVSVRGFVVNSVDHVVHAFRHDSNRESIVEVVSSRIIQLLCCQSRCSCNVCSNYSSCSIRSHVVEAWVVHGLQYLFLA